MVKVVVQGSSEQVKAVRGAANYAQRRVAFVEDGVNEEDGHPIVPIRLTDAPVGREPFRADRHLGVRITTKSAREISQYADMSEDLYLLVCGLLGLTQWRALLENPNLKTEDFLHRTEANCLFAHCGDGDLFPCLLEEPDICSGCVDFYHVLGADSELLALQETLQYAVRYIDSGRNN